MIAASTNENETHTKLRGDERVNKMVIRYTVIYYISIDFNLIIFIEMDILLLIKFRTTKQSIR